MNVLFHSFPNDPCASSDGLRNGTCYTATECQSKGGINGGTCASGFGVCCVCKLLSLETHSVILHDYSQWSSLSITLKIVVLSLCQSPLAAAPWPMRTAPTSWALMRLLARARPGFVHAAATFARYIAMY